MNEPARKRLIRTLHEVAFVLNILFALAIAVLEYIWKTLIVAGTPARKPYHDVAYHFFRAAARINDVLGVEAKPAVTLGHGVLPPGPWTYIGQGVAFLATVLATCVIVVLIFRLFARTRTYRGLLSHASLVTALFILPVCYLAVLGVSRSRPYWAEAMPPHPYWQHPLVRTLALEAACLLPLLLAHRFRPVRAWLMAACLAVHYGFWILIISVVNPVWDFRVDGFQNLYAWYFFFAAASLSGFIWLLYAKTVQGSPSDTPLPLTRAGLLLALASFVTLVLIWHPGRAVKLPRVMDDSLSIKLTREPWDGPIPAYTLTVFGTGRVEYWGRSGVRVRGRQIAFISQKQVTEILDRLDRLNFFNLEDRAFGWSYHASAVGVSVASGDRTKTVVSDRYPSTSKIQRHFVTTADEIDNIVGSSRWVSCAGYCR